MTLEFAPLLRNARLDAIESHIGTAALLKLFTGTPPATLGDADSGTLVASMTLPSDWMNAASGGQMTKAGTWEDLTADNGGTVGYFRIYTSGSVAKIQGTVSITAGGGDMELDNNVVTAGQKVTITTFTITDGNADS